MAKPGELTPKQAKFVREYLIDYNGAQAAIRAGYAKGAAKEQASRLLTNAHIKGLIANASREVAEKTETDAEWVRRRLKEEANDFSEFSSHSARIKAIELIGKINGVFEADNSQSAPKILQIGRIELVAVVKSPG